MLYSKKYFHLFLVLVASFYSIDFSASAQSNQDKESLLADSLFRSKQYAEALPYLNDLLKTYPKDPVYHYQLGVSYLYATTDIGKAIEHLRFASTGEVPNLVYYHLGYAYHTSYQFDEAISYYRRFTVNGEDPSVSAQQIEQLVSQCENGNFMLRYIHQPNIIDNKLVAVDEFASYVVTKPATGSFIQTPKDLWTKYDVDENHISYIFYPNNPKPGDKILYSSYGATTLYGKDLFLIEMLEDGFWSKPQNLGDVINSRLDEDFPYLSPDGLTLYFASKGHYSMGGYDIYRSVYNPSARQWSTPENLGFPISSPYDDFFYVPDRDEQMAVFVTQRTNLADSANVVLVEIDKNPIRRTISSIETIQEIAQLNPNAEGLVLPSVAEDESEVGAKPKQPNTASFSVVENDPEYTRALANGFAQQMLADSLRKKLENLRARFDNISTAEARRNLEKQVVDVEDKLLEAQRNADLYFAKASQIEQDYLTGKRRPIDKPGSSFTTDHPDYLYQAQYAPTVFQIEELSQLAKLERIQPQLQQQREKIKSAQIKLADVEDENLVDSKEYEALYGEYITLLQKFNNLMGSHIGGKKKLYNDCISVALIKAGANSNLKIKNEIDRANTHFRSAMAIRNNATPESVDESEYEALLLEELAVVRLEIAFAKLWEMQLFEQQLLSKVYRLEQNIFGHTLPNSNQTERATVEKDSHIIQQSDKKVYLQKIDDQPITTQEFDFEPDKDPPFQILDKTPYSNDNPIPQHNPLPDGLVYKIQLAAFSKQISYDTFKGMTPITAEPLSNGKVTKYYAGLFTKLDEAEMALPKVRSLGFKDAFIVAWHDGRSVTLTRASGLEASTPTMSNTSAPDTTRIAIEEDGKLYVIQLGGYVGRLPADMLQTIRALAPGKDIVRKPDNQGGFLYSIGSYTDPNEATRIKDNLVASGIKSAIVVAVDVDN
jgi:hypothetical protein